MDKGWVVDAVLDRTRAWAPAHGVKAGDLAAARKALAGAYLADTRKAVTAGRGLLDGVTEPDPATRERVARLVDDLAAKGTPEGRGARAVPRSSLDLDPAGRSATAGMQPAKTLGPFVDDLGIDHHVDVFPVAKAVPITGLAGPLGYLVLPRLPAPRKQLHLPGQPVRVRLGAGGLWLSVRAVAGGPAGRFAGFSFTGGSAELTDVTRDPAGELVLGPTSKLTLELDLAHPVADPPPDPPPGPLGADALAMAVDLPATVTVVFTAKKAAVTSFAPAGATVYGAPVSVTGAAPKAAVVDAGLAYLAFAGEVSVTDLAPATMLSTDIRPGGTAAVAAGGWALPVATATPASLAAPAGAGALFVRLGAGWTAAFAPVPSPLLLDDTTLVLRPGSIVVAGHTGARTQTTRLPLWVAAEPVAGVVPPPPARDSELVLAIGPGSLVFLELTPDREAATVACAALANLDRPLAADGSRLPLEYERGFASFARTAAGRSATVVATAPGGGVRPRTIALANALVAAAPSDGLVLRARPAGGRYEGRLVVRLPVGAVLPTLPDPYAASFDVLRLVDRGRTGLLTALLDWTRPSVAVLRFELTGAPELPGDLFTLLDVSTSADQFGVAVATAGVRDRTQGKGPATTGGMAVDAQSLAVPDARMAVYALPGISWEPVVDDKSLAPGNQDPDWWDAYSPDDGPPTLLHGRSVDLVRIEPGVAVPRFAHTASRRPTDMRFTLPFGLVAQVESDPAEAPKSVPAVRLVPSAYATGLAAGLQLAIVARAHKLGTASLPGSTTTGSPVLPPPPPRPMAYGDFILGNVEQLDAAYFFNPQFAPDGLEGTREVPVSRIDLSGYGTSMFSEWNNEDIHFVGVVRTHFDVLVGRTAFELVQIQTVIVPWCIRITRTIIFDRFDTGLVVRHDTGWKAVSDGRFESLSNAQVVPGAVQRLTNIHNIQVDPGTAITFPSPTQAEYYQPYPGPIGPGHPAQTCDFVPVFFDADVVVDPALVTMSAGGAPTHIAAARRVAGWAQRNIGYAADAAEILTLMQKLGPAGASGILGATVSVGGASPDARFTLDVTSFSAAGTSKLVDTRPAAVAVALHGTPRLPRDGAWSITRRPAPSKTPSAVDPRQPLPLVRARGNVQEWRLLDAVDALSPASPATFYGIMQGTGTSKTLFEHTVIAPDGKALRLDAAHPPNLADVGALLGASDVFPDLGAILRLDTQLNPLKLEPTGQGFAQKYVQDITGVPDRTLLDLGVISIVLSYQVDGTPTRVTFVLDPTGSPRWSLDIENLSFLVKVDGLGTLLTFTGGFAGDERTPPTVKDLDIVYGPPLDLVKEVMSGLGELLSSIGIGEVELDVAFSGSHLSVRSYLAVPTIPLGFGDISDVTIDLGFDATIPSSASFHVGLGSREKPFTWLVSPLSGTGAIVLGVLDGEPDIYIEGGIGAGLGIDVAVASGSASITLELALEIAGSAVSVTGGLRGQAEVSVLGGIASASLTLEASITVTADPAVWRPDDIELTGEVSVGIHISICWIIDIDFDGSWQFSQTVPV
ncbi:MAG TPA: hypothetical protein VFJ85_07345 [Acidimicrobiales bacterium]|nr:hypothetical protein [Acidimicrobiales bacterium]